MIKYDNIIPKEFVDPIRDDMNSAMLQLDIPAISIDTAAKIMAVLYLYGNNEDMVFNKKLLADIRYIQRRFLLCGGETPNPNFVRAINLNIAQAKAYEKEYHSIPDWAITLFHEWYHIELR